jgi:AraC family transcriptional regulator, ethanolamine operon transcriptional activator
MSPNTEGLVLEFDRYTDELSAEGYLVVQTKRATAAWRFESVHFNHSRLQAGWDGGARIIIGTGHPNRVRLIVAPSAAAPNRHTLLLFPPPSRVLLASTSAGQWISLVIAADRLRERSPGRHPLTAQRRQIELSEASGRQLFVSVRTILASYRSSDSAGRAEQEERLVREFASRLSEFFSDDPAPTTARHSGERELSRITLRALDILEAGRGERMMVRDWARRTDVGERMLLRAFQHSIQMGPKALIKYYRLNSLRRVIRQQAATNTSLTHILSGHGISEFGRFAAEYKELFGESPSATLSATRSNGTAQLVGANFKDGTYDANQDQERPKA